jgi:hypothetical protein
MDWSKIINEMLDKGTREVDMAVYCNTSTASINRLKNGKVSQPMADVGFALVEMHKKVMKANKNG